MLVPSSPHAQVAERPTTLTLLQAFSASRVLGTLTRTSASSALAHRLSSLFCCLSCTASGRVGNNPNCTVCEAGTTSNNRVDCDSCTAGRFKAVGATACANCTATFYSYGNFAVSRWVIAVHTGRCLYGISEVLAHRHVCAAVPEDHLQGRPVGAAPIV